MKPRASTPTTIEHLEPRCLLAADVSTWINVDFDEYDASRILVKLKDTETCLADAACAAAESPSTLLTDAVISQPFGKLPELFEVELSGSADFQATLSSLRENPAVEYAEPDYEIQVTAVPNDPRYDELWGLNNTGQTGGIADADIDAQEAWDIHTGSGNTIVAVIDTGVDHTHPDLAANMWVNSVEADGVAGIDDDGNGFVDDVHGYDFVNNDGDPMDDHGHGTHVAGTIAAVGDNGIGVAGVSWNTQIMGLKFLDSSGSGSTSNAIRAIDYAIDNGATISNNSWGFNGEFSQALYDAVERAQVADHVFVAAAGNGFFGFPLNNDQTPFWPSSFDLPNVVAVAATDSSDAIAPFSNYGLASVDLAAPGVGILSTTPNNSYSTFNGTSMASPHVAGVVAMVRDISPGWTYQQVIDHVLNNVDPIPAMDGRSVTGGRLNSFNAVSTADPSPEVQVKTLTENVTDDGVFDYGSTAPGVAITETFTVKNLGTLPLTVGDPTIQLDAGLTLLSTFDATILEAGETVSFTIRLDAENLGQYQGSVTFATNDEDENPFNFTISSEVAIPPAIQVIDNGDAGFSTAGEWTQWNGQGHEDDVHESFPGGGSDVATWRFERQLPGLYWIAASWSEYSNRATDAPFTIQDDNTVLQTVRVNQQLPADDLIVDGTGWEYLEGPYQTDTGTLVIRMSDGANGRLNADAIRIERLPERPEIQVLDNGVDITDGTGSVTFPTANTGSPTTKTFTVLNRGTEALTLSSSISLPTGFSLVSGPSDTELGAGESTTFVVQLDASTIGVESGTLQLTSNDADEGTFDFTVSGTIVQVIDNGDVGFSTVGEWTGWGGQGFLSDVHESFPGVGNDTASWTFNGLNPGVYRVAATWSHYENRASDANYTIVGDGATSIEVNQKQAPNEFTADGAAWNYLGTAYSATGGTLTVVLDDLADGRLNADAIRLEPLPDKPELQVLFTDERLENGDSFEFGNTPAGTAVQRTFSVVNLGGQDLVLNGDISLPTGYSLVSSFGSTTLAAGESTNFTVQLDASSSGWYEGDLSFTSNDSDEGTFSISIAATVALSPPIQIIDNGDPGFSTTGEWTQWSNQGRENDVHESLPGNGLTDVARWTFGGLEPGVYQVSATWFAWLNRASDSPFRILDGNVEVGFEAINQQLVPDDFSDAGSDWEHVGVPVVITSGTLVVELSDNANGNLNADAIRIERLNNEERIVDNGDPSFNSVGEWTRWTGQGFSEDVAESFPGIGADVAIWSFPGMQPGSYRISATWTHYHNRATNAPFTIIDGSNNLGTFLVNQQLPADDFADAGALWADLTTAPFAITDGNVVIQLHDNANGRLNADAIRLERIVEPNIAGGGEGEDSAATTTVTPWFTGLMEAFDPATLTALEATSELTVEEIVTQIDLEFLTLVVEQIQSSALDEVITTVAQDLASYLSDLDELFV